MLNEPIRVLLADDHAVVRAGIRQFLEQADDIRVIGEADDGEAAKLLIERDQPDVAVLDIKMPKASGIEVTTGHFGLLGLHERAEMIGGHLEIQSNPALGTQVSISLPLTPAVLPVEKQLNEEIVS
jgi:signal transduction histidine kinase